ncbi:MAG: hypothetical protein QNJ97_09700 [Myxococcota bacterium]|nr:hypothetical protein [Myxococcota bacterium]
MKWLEDEVANWKKALTIFLVIFVGITILANWGGMSLAEMMDLYDKRGQTYWRMFLLTFPLAIGSFFAFLGILLMIEGEVPFTVPNLLLISIVALFGTTMILNGIAAIPIDYTYSGEGWQWSDLFINLYGLMAAYFDAYQPFNFVCALFTGLYWSVMIRYRRRVFTFLDSF